MKEEKHNFQWAIEQMKKGKKIKRHNWNGLFFELDMSKGGGFYKIIHNENKEHDKMLHSYYSYLATDWEIYEEPVKTLYGLSFNDNGSDVLDIKDVKQFIKELIEWGNLTTGRMTIEEKIKELAGKELLK